MKFLKCFQEKGINVVRKYVEEYPDRDTLYQILEQEAFATITYIRVLGLIMCNTNGKCDDDHTRSN